MDWLTALWQTTRNGLGSMDRAVGRFAGSRRDPGSVPLRGHGGLSADQLASAGASLEVRPSIVTVDHMRDQRERLEAFVERATVDVNVGALYRSYWDGQFADVDEAEEIEALAAVLDPLEWVEVAAIVGWVLRNAALYVQRPIADLAGTDAEVGDDALRFARTILDSPQRLDPTDGGILFSLTPLERRAPLQHGRWRSRGRYGDLWVYGD